MTVTLREQHEAMGLCLTKRPVRTTNVAAFVESRANSRGHTRFGGKKNRQQVEVGVFLANVLKLADLASMHPFVVVRLTRCAKSPLDDDNAVTAMKSFRDGIAKAIGINDRSSRVRYVVDQQAADTTSIEVRVYVPDVDDSALNAAPTRSKEQRHHGEQVEVQRKEVAAAVDEGRRPRKQPRADDAALRRAEGAEGDAPRDSARVGVERARNVPPPAARHQEERRRLSHHQLKQLATPNYRRNTP